jgi:hypothetical protein
MGLRRGLLLGYAGLSGKLLSLFSFLFYFLFYFLVSILVFEFKFEFWLFLQVLKYLYFNRIDPYTYCIIVLFK